MTGAQGPGAVRVHVLDIRALEPDMAEAARTLPAQRRSLLERCRRKDDRLRCLAGGLLIKDISGGREVRYTPLGKPFLAGGPHFSLAHSGDLVCLAVSERGPVGLDIEQWRPRNFAGLSGRVFHPDEAAYFQQRPGAERFYRLWTAKESYVKMLGTGLRTAFPTFSILPALRSRASAPCLSFLTLRPGYTAALCRQPITR